MEQNSENRGGIKASETTFDIIETIHEAGHIRLVDLAEGIGIANSTAFDHLATLERRGYVIKDPEGYRLGLKLLDHGMQAKDHYCELLDAAEPVLEQLVEETDEAVNLVVEEHDHAVYIARLTGDRGVPTNSWVGKRKQIHTLSAGKAILAHLPAERIDELVGRTGLEEVTANTITARDALKDELETIRERGVAFNNRESHDSIRAVGAPIILDDTVQGAVSVAGPARRLTGEYFETEIPDLLLGAVNEIELKLAYQ
ncbi:IclR family transcriptional regulator [Natronosalvus rutilus]|uniref:IclR family transcriptional regulator n=1 Tax=Natronosalvus rutilus TaxID=2953753 RepID=A0A9E7SUH9_9EURY|nr:IclR family transcriptional regulator [Natronosalvus rutilus]UTF54789.1 IclR family transcriptional regulator [Natronosalvus rutilus]